MKVLCFFLIVVLFVCASCQTGPVKIEDDITAAELVQRGQAAYDWNRYAQAAQYYTAILERFPFDIEKTCEAQYEIARIHYKQNQYDTAREEMEALRERYNSAEAEILPSKFKILSEIVLAQIDEKQQGLLKKGKRTNDQ
jgi:outer membrane protein assembly factor BamD (BamD/ComL family)